MHAEKGGKSPAWVTYRLRFGRFLHFFTTVNNQESLPKTFTEGRFRSFWERTDKNEPKEAYRFRSVIKLIESEATISAPRRPAIGKAIREHFADGKWHDSEVIAKRIEADLDHVRETLDGICNHQSYNCKAEKKRVGPTGISYRIFNLEQAISTTELLEKLTPIIERLKAAGKLSAARASPAAVAILAAQLDKLLAEWVRGE